MKSLANKVVLITGAGAGIGKAIAELFAKQGAHVMLSDINRGHLEEAIKEIKASGGIASGYPADMSKLEEVRALIDHTFSTLKSIDILVNNAGIMDNFAPVEDVSDESWEKILGVNLSGPFYACRAIMKIFKQQKSGSIINIASVAGLGGGRAGLAYTVSKHGLIGLTKSIAYQYAEMGIRCNAIAAGGIATDIMHDVTLNAFGYDRMTAGAGNNPGTGRSEDIAELALYLASDKSKFINGAVMVADGGWTAY